MPSTYTTSLKIQEIASGEQSGVWGTTTNTNWTLIEQAVAGAQTITMANANYTLTSLNGVLDEARNMTLIVDGTNSGVFQVIAPLVEKFYVIRNATVGGYAITIGGATGSIVTIPNGTVAQVFCDGTNFYSAQTSSAGNFNVNGNAVVDGNLTVAGATTAYLTTSSTAVTQSVGDNSTKIATTAFVTQNGVITGALLMWPTTSAPSGYLLCNGSAVSRSSYSALFALIGTTFGAGDGSTTFNLPNYTDRMPIGKGTIAASIGTTGGSADAITVAHTHTLSASGTTASNGDHQHDSGWGESNTGPFGSSGRYPAQGSGRTDYDNYGFLTSTAGAHTHSVSVSGTTASTGSSGTNANLPPYMGINFIIKT